MPEFKKKPLYEEILEFSKQSAALNLLDNGVDANFIQPILEMLNSNVVSGSNLDDLIEELKVFVTGGEEGVGALQRYVTQVSNDSLTQFNATYNQTITQDLGIEFYQYTGTIIAGTRPFCDKYVRKYFHKKEVEELGVAVDPFTGKSLASLSTKGNNLLEGRIKGTNASNIFINRGGWNCRHHFSPISARFVPKKDLQRNVNNGNWQPTERQKQFLNN